MPCTRGHVVRACPSPGQHLPQRCLCRDERQLSLCRRARTASRAGRQDSSGGQHGAGVLGLQVTFPHRACCAALAACSLRPVRPVPPLPPPALHLLCLHVPTPACHVPRPPSSPVYRASASMYCLRASSSLSGARPPPTSGLRWWGASAAHASSRPPCRPCPAISLHAGLRGCSGPCLPSHRTMRHAPIMQVMRCPLTRGHGL